MFTPKSNKKQPSNKNKVGKLSKSGKIWNNNLLDSDFTSGQSVVRRIK